MSVEAPRHCFVFNYSIRLGGACPKQTLGPNVLLPFWGALLHQLGQYNRLDGRHTFVLVWMQTRSFWKP